MADLPNLPSSKPNLTAEEEHKAEVILRSIDKELSGLPSGQEINILHHVIEDLFCWRQACIQTEHPRDVEAANQGGAPLVNRLSSLLREYEKHRAGGNAITKANDRRLRHRHGGSRGR